MEEVQVADPINAPYALGGDAFEMICKEFEKLERFERLLEFGSGASTLAFAKRFPNLSIDSVDHDPEYAARIPEDLANRVQLHLVPLKRSLIKGVWCRSYDFTPAFQYDAVLVDGPPSKFVNGRFAALVIGQDHVKPDGVVILDDAKRFNELYWSSLFVAMSRSSVTFFDSGHGLMKFSKGMKGGRLPRLAATGAFVSSSLQIVSALIRQ